MLKWLIQWNWSKSVEEAAMSSNILLLHVAVLHQSYQGLIEMVLKCDMIGLLLFVSGYA